MKVRSAKSELRTEEQKAERRKKIEDLGRMDNDERTKVKA
jgi:hypothetical protein